jgi:hypothetical protein
MMAWLLQHWPCRYRVMIFGFLPQNLKTQAVAVAFSIAWTGSEVELGAEDGAGRGTGWRGSAGSCTGA